MTITPLMEQYYKIKGKYPDTILLYRVGDFFETFADDAKIASSVLGITLTKRSNGGANNVPLAGFPHHAVNTYLPKLVRAGYRVAICEQTEDPKFTKGIVKREVQEIVTPGVALTEELLDYRRNNYLAAIFIKDGRAGLAFADISTAEFSTCEIDSKDIDSQIRLRAPSEILIPKGLKSQIGGILEGASYRLTKIDDWIFSLDYGRDILLNHFKTVNLKGFGIEDMPLATIASGAVLNYLSETQKDRLSHITRISRYETEDFMLLDSSTRKNLEISCSMQDYRREGSLIGLMDKTRTAMGARMLKEWFASPLIRIEPILKRQDAIDELYRHDQLRERLGKILGEIGDLERIVSRVATFRANPRELLALSGSIEKFPLIKDSLAETAAKGLTDIRDSMILLPEIAEKIKETIAEDPPVSINDGGFIRESVSAELDELRGLRNGAKNWVLSFQDQERQRTGISSLKVSFNRVFGYYIQISNANLDKVPEDYIRKQTLVNQERFITEDLKKYEEKILNAQERITEIEIDIFNRLRSEISALASTIQDNARLIGILDTYLSLAICARDYGYTKPEISEKDFINIKGGRHPVVESILPPGEKFTPNDCKLDKDSTQIIMLTGPNMAGKSVYLRQTGLIVLMAQIGSFVPAESAQIGLVDKIFTRVGAQDNISKGESTFLVEMQETANILNNATKRSLILLDEIGRGTSTFDGISIAWSVAEYIHENPDLQAKTLFATHYHELNEMAQIFPRIKNFRVAVKETGDRVIFLHRVVTGGADHSFGIQVARMAGLPVTVTERAKQILNNLESKELTPTEFKAKHIQKIKEDELQLSLFEIKDDKLRNEISSIQVDNLTPIEALLKLAELKDKVDN